MKLYETGQDIEYNTQNNRQKIEDNTQNGNQSEEHPSQENTSLGCGGIHWCQLKPESLDKSRFYLSPDPPKSPLRRGTREKTLVPPFLRGARGDLDLIVKQQSVIGFDVKLTPMGIALSKAALLQSSPEIFVFVE